MQKMISINLQIVILKIFLTKGLISNFEYEKILETIIQKE